MNRKGNRRTISSNIINSTETKDGGTPEGTEEEEEEEEE
jgi:hypothetical protein